MTAVKSSASNYIGVLYFVNFNRSVICLKFTFICSLFKILTNTCTLQLPSYGTFSSLTNFKAKEVIDLFNDSYGSFILPLSIHNSVSYSVTAFYIVYFKFINFRIYYMKKRKLFIKVINSFT